jgi:cellobionic acid phosphorylase
MRATLDDYCFLVGQQDIGWRVKCKDIDIEISLNLPVDDVVELWQFSIANSSTWERQLSIYPYFPVGYMSWMNQSGEYRADLGGVVCTCVTPYQKVEDYFRNRHFKDKTFLLHDTPPDAWEAAQAVFEGEGGVHCPDGVNQFLLGCGEARYETPAAILQYRLTLAAGERRQLRFLFGPAHDDQEILMLRQRYLSADGFARARDEYRQYLAQAQGCLTIETPDTELDNFVNHWLPRQMFYHGDVNRLCTDPQTRNYLQDNMGMTYLNPSVTRSAFLHALSQQKADGSMPDGILLLPEAELKYINQIPHADHCVWLPVCLQSYLDETNDYALLDIAVMADEDQQQHTVFERITRAMEWLLAARDERGLSYIAQGDWCDPMNMVGYKGRGVSGWLSVATAYACSLWTDICTHKGESARAEDFRLAARDINRAVNQHLWDGEWFGRGITDDGVVFGVSADTEGRIFLNPQSWALLSGAADARQKEAMLHAVEQQLDTPYGVAMLAPAYTVMREDVGRVTQKHPGSAENGSVYNHAAAFYVFSLYAQGDGDRAWRALRKMLPGDEDYLQRGQLPVFIPNYYRGAWRQYPKWAGRSSQLFNTGTVAWVYRCLVEGMFGLRGEREGLRIAPQLPTDWPGAKVERRFRGAVFDVSYSRVKATAGLQIIVDGRPHQDSLIRAIEAGRRYRVEVTLPAV